MTTQRTSSPIKFVPFNADAPKSKRAIEIRNRQITFSDAGMIVAWLNGAKGKPAYSRVLDIREELEHLGTGLAELRRSIEAVRSGGDPKKASAMYELRERFRTRHNEFNKVLSRYVHVPALAYVAETEFWYFQAVPRRHREPEIKINDGDRSIRVSEVSVVPALARLATKRELNKVRLCAYCGERWLVSLRKIDKFCSSECRKAYHAHSEEGKCRHREAQRKYRESAGYIV